MNIEEVWWRKYRVRQFRRRKKVNVEMAIRGIFKDCFNEYVRNCSIAGVRQMSDNNSPLLQRLVWILLFGVMSGVFGYFIWYLWFENLSKPLIVTMESSTYPISKLDFPAVAICNVNRISKKALLDFEKSNLKNHGDEDLTLTRAWQLGRLLDFTYNESSISNHIRDAQTAYSHSDKVISTMRKLTPSCDEMLLVCMWGGVSVDCKEIFTVRRTYRGYCCVFNYVLDYNAAGTPNLTPSPIKRQFRPGALYGLNVIVDPLLEDYAYTTRNVAGVEVLVFDSTHYADPHGGRVIQRIAEPNAAIYLSLKTVKQIATREVRKYALETRNCLFHDERKKQFNNLYSYSACIIRCKITTVQTLCKCTPFFMPSSSDLPICTLQQLRCLNKYKEKLLLIYPMGAESKDGLEKEIQDSLYCPECFPDCEFTKHSTRAFKTNMPLVEIKAGHRKLGNFSPAKINMTDKCFLSIYQSTYHGTLDRLDVVSYWYELVSEYSTLVSNITSFKFMYILLSPLDLVREFIKGTKPY